MLTDAGQEPPDRVRADAMLGDGAVAGQAAPMIAWLLPWLLAPLALLGWLLSLYFTAVTYGWMEPDARLVPRWCRMEKATCQRIVHTAEASVAGLPNSVLGLGYHGLVLAWLATRPWPPIWASALAAAALATVAVGAWLSWALMVRLRTPCPLCLAAHAINLVLAVGVVGAIVGAGG